MNGGGTWQPAGAIPNPNVMALNAAAGVLLAGTYDGLYRSTDGGTTWADASAGLAVRYTLGFARHAPYVFAATSGGVHRSVDGGASWTPVSNGLTNSNVFGLLASGSALFAATSGGGVYRSLDAGGLWTSVGNGLTNPYCFALAAMGRWRFVGTSGGGVFRSADEGDHWTPANDGLGNFIVRDVVANGPDLFATTANGVFWSADSGVAWTSLTADLINPNADGLAVSGSHLVVGTAYHGIAYRAYPGATVGVPVIEPAATALAPVSPNPVAGNASIVFRLTRPSRVRLIVCDVAGRAATTLLDGDATAGEHAIRLDASALRAGVYFCTLSAPGRTASRRFAVVR